MKLIKFLKVLDKAMVKRFFKVLLDKLVLLVLLCIVAGLTIVALCTYELLNIWLTLSLIAAGLFIFIFVVLAESHLPSLWSTLFKRK